MLKSLHPLSRLSRLKCFRNKALSEAQRLESIDAIESNSFLIQAAVIERKIQAITVNK